MNSKLFDFNASLHHYSGVSENTAKLCGLENVPVAKEIRPGTIVNGRMSSPNRSVNNLPTGLAIFTEDGELVDCPLPPPEGATRWG